MDSAELQRIEEQAQQFKASIKKRFPTMTGVVAVGSLTSQAMKVENRRRHAEALRKRAAKKR